MVNTLVLSVFERTRELGMLRAIGMTRRQARRMIRHESVITALIGAALGLGLGVFLAALVTQALSKYDVGRSRCRSRRWPASRSSRSSPASARRSCRHAGPRGSTCSTRSTTSSRRSRRRPPTLTRSVTPAAPPLTRRGGRTRETLIFRIGLALIALHVLDDNFVQPQPGTSPGDHLVSGLVPLALLGLAAWAYPRLRGGRRGALVAGPRRARHRRRASRRSTTRARSAPRATTSPACSRSPPACCCSALGAATLWRTRRTEGSLWWRYPRRALLGVAGLRRRRCCSCSRSASATSPRTSAARSCRRTQLGVAYEDVEVRDQRRARARGLVRPVTQRRRRDRVPGPQRPAEADAHARPPRLRRAAVRPPRRGQERGRPATRSAGAATRTSRPRSPTSSAGPTSTPTASAASDSPSAAS